MTVQRKSTEERRTEIADAALRLIASRGVAALTVAALARELGLTGGALFRHFSSTDAILEAVARRAVELLEAATPPATLPPKEWLTQFVNTRTAAVSGHAGLSRLLLSEQFTLALPVTAVAMLKETIRRTRESIVRTIAAAQEAGEFRADLPATALAPIVIGTIQMIAARRAGTALPRVEGDPMELLDTLLTLLTPLEATTRRNTTAAPKKVTPKKTEGSEKEKRSRKATHNKRTEN